MYTIQPTPGPHRSHPPPPPPLSVPGRFHNPYSMPTMTLIQRERNHEGFLVMDEPLPTTTQVDGREWSLEVPQQPIRARMCGFGDKDRRPITPPPCVRLVVRDVVTGKEIDAQEIDISFFVITVDLWDEDAQKEVNLVKHAANSPSISTATAVAFPHTQSGAPPSQPYYTYHNNYPSPSMAQQSSPGGYYPNQGSQGYGAPSPSYGQYGQTQYGYNHSSFGPNSQQSNGQYPHTTQHLSPSHPSYLLSHQQQALATPHQPTGMFTRNLIGALSASAFRLHDQHDRFGVWFILQDLSIRTDGIFRLKFNFVNVGVPKNDKLGAHPTSPMTPTSATSIAASTATLNTSSAPVLASVFSKPFQVFSAKKFPGVIESTELSKTFAQQGIKIPIRKDGDGASGGKKRRNAEEEDDDGDDDQ